MDRLKIVVRRSNSEAVFSGTLDKMSFPLKK